jgi:integral membrane protein
MSRIAVQHEKIGRNTSNFNETLTDMFNPITLFRIVALAEGISFLVLLGIAMPLKYMADSPGAVRIVGSIHGGLFVLYLITIFFAARYGKWSIVRIIEAIVASIIPLGPFFLERNLQRESAAIDTQTNQGDVKSAATSDTSTR